MDLICCKCIKFKILGVLGALIFFSACQDNTAFALGDDNPSASRTLVFHSSSLPDTSGNAVDPKFNCSDSTRIIGEFTDVRDGHVYKTAKIGNQVWMAENLLYKHEEDGTHSIFDYSWNEASGGVEAGCPAKGYFVLEDITFRNCPMAMPAQGLCPDGWRLPTADDFKTLIEFAGGFKYAGKYLKSTIGWDGVGNGVDCFGFNLMPSTKDGFAEILSSDARYYADVITLGFSKYTANAFFWTSPTDWSSGNIVRCIQGEGKKGLDVQIHRAENTYAGAFDSLTDARDGHVYKTVDIGGWVWMAENLSYGSKETYTYEEMINAPVTGCYLDSLIWGDDYGMWNYCSAKQPVQGICPDGWHVPSYYEWRVLSAFVNGLNNATNFVEGTFMGPMLKSTSGWPDGKNGLDAYGFGAKPPEGKDQIRFWSSSNAPTRGDWFGNIVLKIGADSAGLETDGIGNSYEAYVRCLKDDESQMQTSSSPLGFSIKLDKPTTYSGEYGEFTDERDGNVYRTVDIDGTVWFADNLKYEVADALSFCNCADTTSCDSRGRLYPWDVAKSVCPADWHLPSVEEANHLLTLVAQTVYDLGGSEYAENFLKDTVGWKYKDGYNTFGFSAVPAGMMYYHFDSLSVIDEESCNYPKVYDSVGITNGFYAFYWVDGLNEKGEQAYIGVGESGGAKSINWYPVPSKKIKNYFPAFSVRCVKD